MMSVIGGPLTAVMTFNNFGYTDTFLTDWLNSFKFAFAVMPFGFLLMGLFSKLVQRCLPDKGETVRNLVTGVTMACVMESIMALSTGINFTGITNSADLFASWRTSFLAALPVGLTLMLVLSLTVKPRIERIMNNWY